MYAASTVERWYYAFKKQGLKGLSPKRSGRGYALGQGDEQRELLLAIRRDHPQVSAALILRTLVAEGKLTKGAVSAPTARREGACRGPVASRQGTVCDAAQAVELEPLGGDPCGFVIAKLDASGDESVWPAVKQYMVAISIGEELELVARLSGSVTSCDEVPDGTSGAWYVEEDGDTVELRLCPCTCASLSATEQALPVVIEGCGSGPTWMG